MKRRSPTYGLLGDEFGIVRFLRSFDEEWGSRLHPARSDDYVSALVRRNGSVGLWDLSQGELSGEGYVSTWNRYVATIDAAYEAIDPERLTAAAAEKRRKRSERELASQERLQQKRLESARQVGRVKAELGMQLGRWRYAYHVKNDPLVDDATYDRALEWWGMAIVALKKPTQNSMLRACTLFMRRWNAEQAIDLTQLLKKIDT